MPLDPPSEKPYGPFCCHSRLIYLQQPLVKKLIETPASVFSNHSVSLGNFSVPCRKTEIILMNDQSQNAFLFTNLN